MNYFETARQLRATIRALLRGGEVPIKGARSVAATDWHKLECDQWNACPTAFWFDPYRYAGTPLEFPEAAWPAYGRVIAQSPHSRQMDGLSFPAISDEDWHWLVRQSDPIKAALRASIPFASVIDVRT